MEAGTPLLMQAGFVLLGIGLGMDLYPISKVSQLK